MSTLTDQLAAALDANGDVRDEDAFERLAHEACDAGLLFRDCRGHWQWIGDD
jgi:hypothetical protein